MFDRLTDAYDVTTDHFCSGAIPVGPPGARDDGPGISHRRRRRADEAVHRRGILYGMTAADVAGEVIDPRDPATLADYESGWRDAIGTEIRLGSAIRRCYSLPEPVQRTGLWALSGEIGVHMDRPSSFFSPAHLKNCSRGATARMRRGSRRRQEKLLDDVRERDVLADAGDLDGRLVARLRVRNDDDVPSLDLRDPVALVAERLDRHFPYVALGDRRAGRYGSFVGRVVVDVGVPPVPLPATVRSAAPSVATVAPSPSPLAFDKRHAVRLARLDRPVFDLRGGDLNDVLVAALLDSPGKQTLQRIREFDHTDSNEYANEKLPICAAANRSIPTAATPPRRT